MTQTLTSSQPKTSLDRNGRKRIVEVIVYLGLHAVVLFLAARTLHWPAAWLYFGMGALVFAIAGVIIIRINPEIINERGRKSDKTEPFDQLFAKFYLPLLLLSMVIPGLDYRFGWTDIPAALQVAGIVLLIPGMALPYWCMVVNHFLTVTVRIQEERGHRVVTSGPYRFVRHPMYLGVLLQSLGAALLLDSWWGLIPALGIWAAFFWRTRQEDRLLQAELAGYSDYAGKVRYRLVPGIW